MHRFVVESKFFELWKWDKDRDFY